MIAFEVSVNDQRLCVAGIGSDGVFNTIVNYAASPDVDLPDPLWIHIGGLANGEHLRWVNREGRSVLKVGDVVQIKIVEAEHVDSPTAKYPTDAV